MRRISWIKAARKDFERLPEAVQIEAETALGIAAEGRKAETAKPLKGFDGAYSKSCCGIAATLSALFMQGRSGPTYG
jgi:phage-related protein